MPDYAKNLYAPTLSAMGQRTHGYNAHDLRWLRTMQPSPLEQIMGTVTRLLPKTPQDVKRNLHAALADVLNRLDLVTREELEVQEAVLQRTRARLTEMEQLIAQLEQRDLVRKSKS